MSNLLAAMRMVDATTIQNLFEAIVAIGSYILSGFVGAVIAISLDNYRYPKLEIEVDDKHNTDHSYTQRPNPVGERWRFLRVFVINKPMPRLWSWLLKRQTAENCRAYITISKIDGDEAYSHQGRWSGTLEPAFLNNGSEVIAKIIQPEPVTITSGQGEHLDILAQPTDTQEAYYWNNEAYAHGWRNQARRMSPGKYEISIEIKTQNGVSFRKTIRAVVSADLEKTELKGKLA